MNYIYNKVKGVIIINDNRINNLVRAIEVISYLKSSEILELVNEFENLYDIPIFHKDFVKQPLYIRLAYLILIELRNSAYSI